MVHVFVEVASTIGLFVTLLFLLSVFIKRNDIADIAWGVGIVLVATLSYALTDKPNLLTYVLTLLAYLWGARLSIRIFLRNIKKEEDHRYKVWRMSWGKWFYLRSFFQVYVLQGFLMIVVGYPFIHASIHASVYGNTSSADASLGVFAYVGIVVWCIGYFFEVVGDYQLDRFLADTKNKDHIMTSGLWKCSRHPNYFGEVTMWWGVWLMVATLPYGLVALISPLTITFLILKVSGIPMLEKRFECNPEFEAYKKRTSAFLPLPPRNI